MEFRKLIQQRYSVRNFLPKEVELSKLETILEAGRMAPSAVNFQPWHFIVVCDKQMMQALANCYHREWFATAPCCIVVCSDHQQSWKRREDGKDHGDIDAAIAIDHMTLQAVELGLGTCWVCNFNVEKTRKLFQFPAHIEPVAFLPVGYPNREEVPVKKRKPTQDIVHWNTFKA